MLIANGNNNHFGSVSNALEADATIILLFKFFFYLVFVVFNRHYLSVTLCNFHYFIY